MRFLFKNHVPEPYERYLKRSAPWLFAAAVAIAATPAVGQQAKPKLSVEERIGKTLGPILVRAALLEGANEELQAIVEQRDRTIAELKAQIESLKKPAEAPQ